MFVRGINKWIIGIFCVAVVSLILVTVYLMEDNTVEFNNEETKSFVNLPNPVTDGTVSVEEAIAQRRSVRHFAKEPLSLKEISQLMWAAQGITDTEWDFRATPSAGATYPLEIYIVVSEKGVLELKAGLYHYNAYEHRLEYLLEGDLCSRLAGFSLGQSWVENAPVNIVITAVYERTTERYGERGIRYVHLEAGHAGQNLYLQATSLDLGIVVVGAFNDKGVQELLELPKDQKPLYVVPVGYK